MSFKRLVLLAVIGQLVLNQSCVRLSYVTQTVDSPLDEAKFRSLKPGTDNLTTSLDALGAPHHVFEHDVHGVAMLWHHVRESGLGFAASYSVVRAAPGASFSFSESEMDGSGAMLWFSPDLKLVRYELGSVRQLMMSVARIPADLEQIEGFAGHRTSGRETPAVR